ncbi:PhzF family phenazine biosynthesis protein [Burkholderia gladioli]|uniref:PhzF family phenazine biosynthesis protein n=5 Tax=Burkholderia TaxID=32008 RepID=UPI001640988B|nr:PhzF family phenazine biosynthesis protein [Burkholderia gladioli]MDD1790019.1 PhzF family phenazine biosynthesis protein [Burkholderia gladioli]MDN7499262.1 PhzF family phenazine biosynthesis protein [Burkholderia gladioli]
MTARRVRFKQVDVFTAVPFRGNPLAVVFDADPLSDAQMQAIARWTNLSETSFVCTPTDPRADYRVRIFTTHRELPFAGHPTLGTAHAVREAGLAPRTPGRLVQQCGAGLVELREPAEGGPRAFAAPPARVTPLGAASHAALAAALRSEAIVFEATPCATDNGTPWLVVRLATAADCLALAPDPDALRTLADAVGALGVAAYAPHPAGGPADFEVRCLITAEASGIVEDPVTGSANAAIAGLLAHQGLHSGPTYTARQGTALGRDGRVSVEYDATGKIWIGGDAITVIDGSFLLP